MPFTMSWGLLGLGSVAAAATVIFVNRARRNRMVEVDDPHSNDGDGDVSVALDADALSLVLPTKLSVGVGAGITALGTVHLVQTSLKHCVAAGVLAGAVMLTGHALDSVVDDSLRFRVPFLTRRRERCGTIVRTLGVSATGVWLSTRITQELFGYLVVCSIAAAPVIDDIADAIHHHGRTVQDEITSAVTRLQDYLTDLSPQCQAELLRLWEARGLGNSANAQVCGELLDIFVAQRAEQLAEVVDRAASVASLPPDRPGGPPGFDTIVSRLFCSMMSTFVVTPWVEQQSNVVRREDFIRFYDDEFMNIVESLVIAAGLSPAANAPNNHTWMSRTRMFLTS